MTELFSQKTETRNMAKMKDPAAGNDLSQHLFSVHGGWYEDALSYQILKRVKLVGSSLSSFLSHPSMTSPAGGRAWSWC